MTYPQQPDADLDRLHQQIERLFDYSAYHYRGEGRTFAYLALIIGEIELSDPVGHYLYLTNSKPEAEYVFKWFRHILPSYCDVPLSWNSSNGLRLPNGGSITFCGVDNRAAHMCGARFSRIWLDLDLETCRQLEKDGKMYDLYTDLNTHLLPDGDIV